MGRFLNLAALLLGLQAAGGVLGQADPAPDADGDAVDVDVEEEPRAFAGINVGVSTTFPDASELFGIKLVNGEATKSLINIRNDDADTITVQFAVGSLWTPDGFDPAGVRNVRNLTHKRFGIDLLPGEKTSLPYNFKTNLHPQELRLSISAIITQDTNLYTVPAFNGTVSVVDPDIGFFDFQLIFLYFFLLALIIGIGYLFYTVWVEPYLPARKKGSGAGGKRRAAAAAAAAAPAKQAVTSDSEGTSATATGSEAAAGAYNEEWIPSLHTQRPEARRVKNAGKAKNKPAKE